MTLAEHKARHEGLHEALDELAADYLVHNRGRTLAGTTVFELMRWSNAQRERPADPEIAVDAHRDIGPAGGMRSGFPGAPDNLPGTGRG